MKVTVLFEIDEILVAKNVVNRGSKHGKDSLTISLVCGEEWARMVALNKFELGI